MSKPTKTTVKPITLDPDRDLWEQQPEESDLAYSYFRQWLAYPPWRRQVKRVHLHEMEDSPKLARSTVTMYHWRYHWRERARAYDDYANQLEFAEISEARRRAAREQIEAAQVFRSKATQRARSIDSADMNPGDTARWAEVSVKLETSATSIVDAGVFRAQDKLRRDLMTDNIRTEDLTEEALRRLDMVMREDDDDDDDADGDGTSHAAN